MTQSNKRLRSLGGCMAPNRFVWAYVAIYVLFSFVCFLDIASASGLANVLEVSTFIVFVGAFIVIPAAFHSPDTLVGACVGGMTVIIVLAVETRLDVSAIFVACQVALGLSLGSCIVCVVRRDWRGVFCIVAFIQLWLFPRVH